MSCVGISSQIREVMEVEITGKRKKGRPRKLWTKERVRKQEFGMIWLETRGCVRSKEMARAS